ncbi:MAG: 50S ribosomal protein L22 [Ignavibacteriae bacterium]|nr:50S ribosomal protein L22 [Ignavibacteriota bacterium]
MEARAINRYIGTSPRKMRLVIDLIRGKSVDQALHVLHFSPKHAARTAEKVLRSAVSNLQNKDEGGRLETADMMVKEAFVDAGMTMKRISPAPMGRAYRIRKRSNHVTIVVSADKEAKKAATRAKQTKARSAKAKDTKEESKKKAPAKPKASKKQTPATNETK